MQLCFPFSSCLHLLWHFVTKEVIFAILVLLFVVIIPNSFSKTEKFINCLSLNNPLITTIIIALKRIQIWQQITKIREIKSLLILLVFCCRTILISGKSTHFPKDLLSPANSLGNYWYCLIFPRFSLYQLEISIWYINY